MEPLTAALWQALTALEMRKRLKFRLLMEDKNTPEWLFKHVIRTDVYWMLLARGKLHIEVLGSDFPCDTVKGMDCFVEKLPRAVSMRFPDEADLSSIVFVDRGEGFHKSNGKFIDEFAIALRAHDLKALHGTNAELQPRQSGELWLARDSYRLRMKRSPTSGALAGIGGRAGAKIQGSSWILHFLG